MSHRRTRSRLNAYLDRELEPREHERVRAHLVECPACRDELEQLKRVVALVRGLPEPQLGHSLSGAVLRNLESQSASPLARAGAFLRDHFGPGALSPVAAAALGVGLVAWVQFSEPERAPAPQLAGLAPLASATAPAAAPREARRLVGAVSDPGAVPQPMPRLFAKCRVRAADVRECDDLYYAWLISQAHEDPPGFASAAQALPRQRLQKLHHFAAGSGSGPWVWRSLSQEGDPRAQKRAAQLVQPVSARR